MPDLRMQLPEVPDVPWQDAQFTFNGQWLPDLDPALIGPENFSTLTNLRYKDKGLEGVSGFTYINSTALTTYTEVKNGHQLVTSYTKPSYNLVQAWDSSDNGRVYQNQTAIGSQGDFTSTQLHNDASTSLQGRFSDAPQGSIVYTNTKESMIWAGEEKRAASFFLATDETGNNILDKTEKINSSIEEDTMILSANMAVDGDMESDPTTNWAANETATVTAETGAGNYYEGAQSVKIVSHAATGDLDGIISNAAFTVEAATYTLTVWVKSSATTVKLQMLDGDDGAAHADGVQSKTVTANAWQQISYEVTMTAGDNAKIQIMASANSQTIYVDNVVFVKSGEGAKLIIMTTRPIQGAKFYIGTANTTNSTLSCKYWTGAAYTATSGDSDGTTSASKALAQTGAFTFTDTDGSAGLRHLEELYMYSYVFTLSAGRATIYQITINCDFQTVKDVWDGVYRQPIQFQSWSADHYEDYTLQVNQSSDVNTPIGGQLDGLLSTDYVIVQFEDQTVGMRWTMLGDLVNVATETMSLYYWDGVNWTAVTNLNDGTRNAAKTASLTQTGLISWDKPSDEEKQTLFGTVGYAYKVSWSGTLTGTKGGAAEVVVDLVYGIPVQKTVKPFDFSVLYKSRVFLGSFSAGNQGNRMDFCAANAPDVWNGWDSSDDGRYSLYFGNEDPLRCAVQLYNRFGSNIFSMLLVIKDGETYVMTGDSPDDFQIFPVSLNTGCPAPLTLATAEMGFEAGQGVQRQVAMWVSHSGPVMFDGAVMQPIRGVDLYFDPTEDECVEWDNMKDLARGWVDHTFKEYNLLIPSTASQSTNNVWLVYDLVRKKWFKKATGTATFPQTAWPVTKTNGSQSVCGGNNSGKIMEMETGTSWGATYASPSGGAGIESVVKTGDFFPSNNIWDECVIRKFKLICEKITSSSTVNLEIDYYGNASDTASNVIFQDSSSVLGSNVDFKDMDVDGDGTYETIWASSAAAALSLSLDVGTRRLVRLIQDMNERGWTHGFEFKVSTTDVEKGWKPIAWGVQYRVDRKDNKATTG